MSYTKPSPTPRYVVHSYDDGTNWIKDAIWPEKGHGDPELISTRCRASAQRVCEILNNHEEGKRRNRARVFE